MPRGSYGQEVGSPEYHNKDQDNERWSLYEDVPLLYFLSGRTFDVYVRMYLFGGVYVPCVYSRAGLEFPWAVQVCCCVPCLLSAIRWLC